MSVPSRWTLSGTIVAASAPKGNLVTYWDVAGRSYLGSLRAERWLRISAHPSQASFLLTSGEGWLATGEANGDMERQLSTAFHWDNHAILVR